MLNHVRSWLYVGDESRPFVVLDEQPGLYGLKYDSATACGLPLYLCSYKLDILLQLALEQDSTLLQYVYLKQKSLFYKNQFLANL